MNKETQNPDVQTPASANASNASLYERSKIIRGDITIFKRYEKTNADYYFRVQAQGKRRMVKLLRTADESFKKARQLMDALNDDRFDVLDQIKARRTITATVNDLGAAYNTAPVDAKAETRRHNLSALHKILRAVHQVEDAGTLPITAIDGPAALRWFELSTEASLALEDPRKETTAKVTANSTFYCASSILIPKALPTYQKANCYHAGFEAFTASGQTHKFTRLPKKDYRAPDDNLIAQTLSDWLAITDRNLFLAIGHELAFGLRRNEMAQATWGHWKSREGYPVFDGPMEVKNNTHYISVRALDPYYNQVRQRIEAEGWRGEPGDWIITGCATNRTDGIYRAVSHWLRSRGWTTTKTNHALRAYVGSQISMKYGIYEAQIFLRHSTVQVTEESYSHFVRQYRPANLDDIPARWATAATEFKPQIVPKVVNG